MVGDWKNIKDDREKYAAYLCSREWSEKKRLVFARSSGMCERCRHSRLDAVHHLTYIRKYEEELADLQAMCKPCHDFIHGHSDFDPLSVFVCNGIFTQFSIAKPNGEWTQECKDSKRIAVCASGTNENRSLFLRVEVIGYSGNQSVVNVVLSRGDAESLRRRIDEILRTLQREGK